MKEPSSSNFFCGISIVDIIKPATMKAIALTIKATSTPYCATTIPPIADPSARDADQVAEFIAFAVNNSLSSVMLGIAAFSAGTYTE